VTPTSAATTAAVTLAAQRLGTGESIVFWVLGTVAVLAALGMILSRNAVHAALLLALDMLCLAVFYGLQEAPFLMFVQVIVYTGAIMMLFLFVLMLVGVDASDSLVETLRGQRVAAALAGLGFGVLVLVAIARAAGGRPAEGLAAANADGNVVAVGQLLFTRHVFAFEVTSALLITAALAAMVLAHREKVQPVRTQQELMRERFRSGEHPTPLPGPGVYARHNAVDTPALLPDGRPSGLSVSPVLERLRDQHQRYPQPSELEAAVEQAERSIDEGAQQ
jgi:NADH-quinone oxidoreductase subunit J